MISKGMFLSKLNRSHALTHDKNKPTNEPTNEQNAQWRNDRLTVEDAGLTRASSPRNTVRGPGLEAERMSQLCGAVCSGGGARVVSRAAL